MPTRSFIIVESDNIIGTQNDELTPTNYTQSSFLNKVSDFFRGLAGGAKKASISYGSVTQSADAVAASQTGVFDDVPLDADTITINGVTMTFVESLSPGNNEISTLDGVNPASVAQLADRTAAAINASTTPSLSGLMSAASNGVDTVTISCLLPSLLGNSVALSAAGVSQGFAFSGAKLAGGTGSFPSLRKVGINRA